MNHCLPDAEPLCVHLECEQDRVIVTPEGELDLATVPDLAAVVAQLRATGVPALTLDLRRVSFLEATGLHYVLALSAERSSGLRLTVVPGPAAVQRVFELTGTRDLVPFAPLGPDRCARSRPSGASARGHGGARGRGGARRL